MATRRIPASRSGVFVVDISGLNLSKSALQKMEKAINVTVDRQLATIDLRVGSKGVLGKRLDWYGRKVYRNIAAGGIGRFRR